MELQETFDRFLADMKLEGKADMTLVEYANRLSRFKKYLIHHKKALNEENMTILSNLPVKCLRIT